MKQDSTDTDPVIETPLSPDREALDTTDFQCNNNYGNSDGLQIEEITDDDFGNSNGNSSSLDQSASFAMEIETMIEDFEYVLKQDDQDEVDQKMLADDDAPRRPTHLDLFSSERNCRPSYTFKNPQ